MKRSGNRILASRLEKLPGWQFFKVPMNRSIRQLA
jgi:hypothetical protein